MDNANMPPSSDNSNDSDDLIAELARLMAAEAKGEPESENPKPAVEPVATPQAAEQLEEPQADPIPRLVPEPAPQEPAPQAARPVPDFVRPPGAQEPVTPPPPQQSRTISPLDAAIAARKQSTAPTEASPPPVQMPDAQSFNPEPQISTPPQPEAAPADDQFALDSAPMPTFEDTNHAPPRFQSPTSEVEPATQADESEDPIGALISAQLESIGPEEFSEPPMSPPPAPEPQSTKDDSFGVPPVFGLGGAPTQPSTEPVKRDPLDDIESLIGTALKTEQFVEPQSTPASAPEHHNQPQIRSAEPVNEVAGAANAAEAAILAATQSMQQTPAGTDGAAPIIPQSARPAGFAPEDNGQVQTGSRPARAAGSSSAGWQKIAGPLVAAALLVAVGLGLYWVFGTNGGEEGDAPVLSADATPAKETPVQTPAESGAAGSVVLTDNGSQSETIERLISRDETLDVAGNEVSRVISQSEPEELGLANRKVRTVTVRPDGTIVNGDDAVAGGQQLPVDRPNVPELSAADTPAAVAANQTTTVTQTPQTLTPQSVVNTNTGGQIPPIPLPRPTNRASAPTIVATPPAATTNSNTNAVNLIANTANQAVRTTQAITPSTPVVSGTSAPAYVQLSSQRTRDAAAQSLNAVRSQFASQLGGGSLEIQEVNLGERGVFYRVRLPAQSIDAANGVCANIKSAGGDCFVRTN